MDVWCFRGQAGTGRQCFEVAACLAASGEQAVSWSRQLGVPVARGFAYRCADADADGPCEARRNELVTFHTTAITRDDCLMGYDASDLGDSPPRCPNARSNMTDTAETRGPVVPGCARWHFGANAVHSVS